MGIIRAIQVELLGENNETFIGTLTIESHLVGVNSSIVNASQPNKAGNEGLEPDPIGASTYVIAVVLIYGLSIVFLIGSHVVLRDRENHRDVEKQINKFLQQTPVIKEKYAKDNYKNLKHSIIPVVALSSARDLVARRKSFAVFINGLHSTPSGSRRNSQECKNSTTQSDDQGASSSISDETTLRMPTIQEESTDDLDRSLTRKSHRDSPDMSNIFPKGNEEQGVRAGTAVIKDFKDLPPRQERGKIQFVLGDDGSVASSDDSVQSESMNSGHPSLRQERHHVTNAPKTTGSRRPGLDSPTGEDDLHQTWVETTDPSRSLSGSPSGRETEHLLHVTCV